MSAVLTFMPQNYLKSTLGSPMNVPVQYQSITLTATPSTTPTLSLQHQSAHFTDLSNQYGNNLPQGRDMIVIPCPELAIGKDKVWRPLIAQTNYQDLPNQSLHTTPVWQYVGWQGLDEPK